jgi:hypothetical protein
MAIKRVPDASLQREFLLKAQNAAIKGDRIEMLEGIAGSLLLEAYLGYFKDRYPSVHLGHIHDCIGFATDELYDRIVKGEKIRKIESYLWKIIDRKLLEYIHERRRLSGEEVDHLGSSGLSIDGVNYQEQKEESRELILQIFESLIPRLGLVNVQEVMKYILGAIRNGVQDVTSDEIADALGLTPENVRQSMKRGFDRLTRIVKEENLVDKSHDFRFLEEMEYYVEYPEDDEQ